MASKIKIKRSAVAGKVPLTTDLELSELAVNTNDGRLYTKKDNGTESIVEIGGPDFGSRNVTTTGTSTAASFTPTSSTVPTNGLYLSAPSSVAISTGGSGRLFVDASGRVGVGTSSLSRTFNVAGSAVFDDGTVQTTVWPQFSTGVAGLGTNNNYPVALVTNGSERLRVTPAGLVGVGTSAPSASLDVNGTANISGAAVLGSTLNLTSGGITNGYTGTAASSVYEARGSNPIIRLRSTGNANNGWIGMQAGNNIADLFWTWESAAIPLTITAGGVERVRIDSSGRVGIGTTNVPAPFCVSRSGNEGLEVTPLTGNQVEIQGYNRTTSNWVAALNKFSQHIWNLNSTTEAARIDASGRLLVGTSSARTNVNGYQPLFQVETAASDDALNRYASFTYGRNNGSGGFGLAFNRHASTTVGGQAVVANDYVLGQLDFNGSDGTNFIPGARISAAVDGTPGANDMPGRLVFSTTADGASSPTERMRITNGGLVQIGGTSVAAGRLNVVTTANERVGVFISQYSAASDAAIFGLYVGKYSNDSTTTQRFIGFSINNDGNGNGQINANGASQAAFGSFSDERLKENIENLPSQLDNIKALRPVEFDYKDGSGHQLGFIAQEMQQVYPDVVSEQDGYLTITGFGKTECRLIKALQEAIAKIEALEAKVAALESA